MDNNYYNNMNQNQNQSTQIIRMDTIRTIVTVRDRHTRIHHTMRTIRISSRQEARHPGNRVAGPDSELPLVSVRQLLWSLVW